MKCCNSNWSTDRLLQPPNVTIEETTSQKNQETLLSTLVFWLPTQVSVYKFKWKKSRFLKRSHLEESSHLNFPGKKQQLVLSIYNTQRSTLLRYKARPQHSSLRVLSMNSHSPAGFGVFSQYFYLGLHSLIYLRKITWILKL